MPKRTEKLLTEFAKPIAEKLAARYGNLKVVMSAGVVSLEMISPADRDRAFAIANGQEKLPEAPATEPPLDTAELEFRQKVLQILKEAQAIPSEKKHGKSAKPLKAG